MSARLGILDDDVILEPSAGEGIFIDEALKYNKNVRIDALDINEQAIDILEEKYHDNSTVNVRKTDTLLDNQLDAYETAQMWLKQSDTLLDSELDIFCKDGGHYTKVIGNPPYGAWQDYDKRDVLKKKYQGQYVKETYSLFLLRCLSVLKLNGRLSFIIPDTFLYLNMHTKLRKIILNNAKIDEILVFPSKFFPGVSFGYSNLSIITLERCENDVALNNQVRIIQGFKSAKEFSFALNKNKQLPLHLSEHLIAQSDVLRNPQCRFILAQEKTSSIINDARDTLADVADVVTGFYSGNNTEFIRAASNTTKGSKGYKTINPNLIFECDSLYGIPNVDEGYIPYIKGSSQQRYVREKTEWYVRWDYQTIDFYNKDKKARFQNSSYYFKAGIAIPMVKSKSIKATLIDNYVFDQSIVGIFPKDKEKLYYLLALFNSNVINDCIHAINPTANNSANYVKQIPYIEPDEETFCRISVMTKSLIEHICQGNIQAAEALHNDINKAVALVYES